MADLPVLTGIVPTIDLDTFKGPINGAPEPIRSPEVVCETTPVEITLADGQVMRSRLGQLQFDGQTREETLEWFREQFRLRFKDTNETLEAVCVKLGINV